METFERHKIAVGSKIRVCKVRSGVDSKGLPYWKFYVPYSIKVNGNPVIYKHMWCRVDGKPIAEEGEWVKLTRINAHCTNCTVNYEGGMEVFEDLVVEVEKVGKERTYE